MQKGFIKGLGIVTSLAIIAIFSAPAWTGAENLEYFLIAGYFDKGFSIAKMLRWIWLSGFMTGIFVMILSGLVASIVRRRADA